MFLLFIYFQKTQKAKNAQLIKLNLFSTGFVNISKDLSIFKIKNLEVTFGILNEPGIF